MNKEEMELRKLALEVKELERPWFVRPANLFSIASLCFAVYQYYTAEIKKGEAKTIISENKITEQFLEDKAQKISEAEHKILTNNKKTDKGREDTTQVTGRVMDVWAYGVTEAEVHKVKNYLSSQGNEVGFGGLLSYRPKWLALESTVFYYHKDSKEIAQGIAQELNKITEINFKIKWGAGLGVKAENKKNTFFVHLVDAGN